MRLTLQRRSTREPGIALPSELTDSELIVSAKIDARAFAELYQRFFDQVYWYCFGRLGDTATAEDATSQIFAKVLTALPRFQPREASVRSWIFRIAHNVVVDEYRGRSRHSSLDEAVELPSAGPSMEDEAINAERHRLLSSLLGRLPEDQRTIVELRLAGLSSVEIGEQLGRKPGAVDTALWRAVGRLRTLTQEISEPSEEGHHASR